MKKFNFQLIFIIFIALALRLYNLGFGFLHTDEAKTALGIDFPHSFLLPTLSVFSQNIFGINNFAVRLPFALLGVVFILVSYFIGRELYNQRGGLVAAFLATFLPVNVILSRTAFLDIALVTAWSFIILFWIKVEKEKRYIDFFFLFLALFISPWFKIQAVYLFFVLFLYLIFVKKGKFWRDKRFWLLVLSGIPFCFYFLSQPQQLYDMMHYTGDEVGSPWSGLIKFFVLLWQSYGFFLIFVLGGFFLMLLKRDWQKKSNILFLIFLFFIFLVLGSTPKRMYYYVMLDIPFIFLSVYFFSYFAKKRWLAILLMSLVVVNLFFTTLVLNKNIFLEEENRKKQMCDRVNELVQEMPEIKNVFLDTNFGFTYKWCLDTKIKKIDNLFNKEIYHNINFIAVLNQDTWHDKKELFKDILVEDYQDMKILIRKK